MACAQCEGIERKFDAGFARKELMRYRRKGPRKTSRMLVESMRVMGISGLTLLDIGGGVGALQFSLLRSGVRQATGVDASSSLLMTAREEAARQGFDDRVDFVQGDFVEVAETLGTFDIVTLDRVICCYHDMPTLVTKSAERARKMYALVYPRDLWWVRTIVSTHNVWLRLRGSPMRTFVHPALDVDDHIRRQGFEIDVRRNTLFWQVVVYRRTWETPTL